MIDVNNNFITHKLILGLVFSPHTWIKSSELFSHRVSLSMCSEFRRKRHFTVLQRFASAKEWNKNASLPHFFLAPPAPIRHPFESNLTMWTVTSERQTCQWSYRSRFFPSFPGASWAHHNFIVRISQWRMYLSIHPSIYWNPLRNISPSTTDCVHVCIVSRVFTLTAPVIVSKTVGSVAALLQRLLSKIFRRKAS